MVKLEFAAHLAAYRQDTKRRERPLVIAMCIALFVLVCLMPTLAATIWGLFAFMGLLLGGTFVMMAVAARMMKQAMRTHHLHCPFCDHVFVGEVSRQIVMATGNCGHCGTRVLDED